MHISSKLLATCLASASLVLARPSLHNRQNQGDASQGGADSTQGDLGGRPPPKFAYPVIDFPNPDETVVFESAYYVQPGEIFDGGMKRYERAEGSCNEQAEVTLLPQQAARSFELIFCAIQGTDADTVFNLLPGSTLRNVVIGKNQAEGVHALGDAWVENVWWEDVCEDALTSKGLNTQLRVIGGGARNATDKVEIQLSPFRDNLRC